MNKILFTFPGQGAQIPGMLHELDRQGEHGQLLRQASDILGEDVMTLDTPEALERTRAVQLCILIAGVASASWLIARKAVPDFVSGLSIGAFPAAVVSGALDFSDALRLVSLRGELMEKAAPAGYGLCAIGGLPERTVQTLADAVCMPASPVYLANINASDQFVIAGSDDAMKKVLDMAREKGATKTDRLAVAVPSHCPLLAEAARFLHDAIGQVTFRRPAIAYLSGSTGRVLWQPQRIADDLAFNMARPVRWADAMQAACERGVRLAIEMPPGAVLTGLAKRVLADGEALSCQQQGMAGALALALHRKAN